MNIRILIYLFALSLISCNSNKEEVKKPAETKWTPGMKLSNAVPTIPVENANLSKNNANGVNVSGSTVNPAHGKPGHRCDIAVGAPLNGTKPNPQATSVASGSTIDLAPLAAKAAQQASSKTEGLNPAHGLPNHRCDVAVGAPLNSKAAVTKAPKVITAAASPTISPNVTGLNPAHGQPGHRCDISVGAPLNSKPVQATKQVAPNQPAATTVNTSVNPPAQTTNATGQKLNPAHGQPGHRCDVAVGSPLT